MLEICAIPQGLSSQMMGLPNDGGPQDAAAAQGGTRRCNCKKAKCLKLYCVCFAAGLYCSGCPCRDCQNTLAFSDIVMAERKKILERSPNAFAPKVEIKGGGDVSHKKGCRCRKSRCLKKYCECFDACVPCSFNCRCDDCHNQPEGGLGLQLNLPHTFGAITAGTSEGNTLAAQDDMNGIHLLASHNSEGLVGADGDTSMADADPNQAAGGGTVLNFQSLVNGALPEKDSTAPFQSDPTKPQYWSKVGAPFNIPSGISSKGHDALGSVSLPPEENVTSKQMRLKASNGSATDTATADAMASFNSDTPTSHHGLQPYGHMMQIPLVSQRKSEHKEPASLLDGISMPSTSSWGAALCTDFSDAFPQAPTMGGTLFDSSTDQQLDPQMLLQPAILLADPQYAAQLAAYLGLDEAHQMASQKSAQILKTLIQLGNENPAFQKPHLEQHPSSSIMLQSDQISENLMAMPLSAVLNTGTKQGPSVSMDHSIHSVPSGSNARAIDRSKESAGGPRRLSNNGGSLRLGSGTFRFEATPKPGQRGSADSAPLSDGCGHEKRMQECRRPSAESGGQAKSVCSMGAPKTSGMETTGLNRPESAFEVEQYAEAALGGKVHRANSLPPPSLPCLESGGVPQLGEAVLHPSVSQPLHRSENGLKRARLGSKSSNERSGMKSLHRNEVTAPSREDLLETQNEMEALQALFDLRSAP